MSRRAIVEGEYEVVCGWDHPDTFFGQVFNIEKNPEVPYVDLEARSVDELKRKMGRWSPWVELLRDALEGDRDRQDRQTEVVTR